MDTTLETVSGVLVIVEVLVFSPQSKPRASKPISSGRFVVSERSPWVMGHEGRERTSDLQEGADGEGFWDVWRKLWIRGCVGGWDGEGGGDLENEGDSGVCE